MIELIISLGVVLLGFLMYVLLTKLHQQQASALQSGLGTFQEALNQFQKQVTVQHAEFERTQELKSQHLRTEIQGLSSTVGTKLEQNLKDGFMQFEKIQHHLKQAELQLLNLNTVGQSINELNNLLKLPHLRGGFGEQLLETLLNDLLPQDAYELQYRISPNSPERVDAVIKYPKMVLPIDSKFPREQVLPLFETNDPLKLEVARKSLADVMKILAKQIKEKYIKPEHGTTEIALLFVPSETLYFEILRNLKLCEDLAKLKIFAVSPNTLAITLNGIRLSREYYEMAKGVEKTITEVKKAEQHFKNFEGRFLEVGTQLARAQTAYTTATTHLSRYESAVTRLIGVEATASLEKAPSTLPANT